MPEANLDTRWPVGQYGGEAVELRQAKAVELLETVGTAD